MGVGVSRFSVEKFLSHGIETFRRGSPLCCVSEKLWQRKSLWLKGKGKYQEFPSKVFCLTVPEKIVGELFWVSKEFWYRKVSSKAGGKLHDFVEIFFLTGPKKIRRGTFLCFTKFLVSKKLWIRGGGRRRKGVPQFSV